jgi:hypothetical protein
MSVWILETSTNWDDGSDILGVYKKPSIFVEQNDNLFWVEDDNDTWYGHKCEDTAKEHADWERLSLDQRNKLREKEGYSFDVEAHWDSFQYLACKWNIQKYNRQS